MPKFFKISIFVFLHFLLPGISNAQKSNMTFRHLTTDDGLSQDHILDILQDRRGFMWFATIDGLNRYDGSTFVVFKHDPNNPATLSNNFIVNLLEDIHGYLWIATYN